MAYHYAGSDAASTDDPDPDDAARAEANDVDGSAIEVTDLPAFLTEDEPAAALNGAAAD